MMRRNGSSVCRIARPALVIALGALVPWEPAWGAAEEPSTVLLRAAKIYVTPEEIIEGGAVLIEAGKIARVGRDIEAPEDARVIERPGGTITAGLIDANSAAGYRDPLNNAEHQSECIPELHVLDMLDLGSKRFDRLAAAGVTTVYVTADAASVIGGQGVLLRTGGTLGERVLREAYGIKATIGREPIFKATRNRLPFGRTSFLTRRPNTRMGLVWVFRKAFHDAQTIARGATPATRGEGSPSEASLPFLIQLLQGEMPLRIQARSQLDILTAIRLTREFNMRFILEEGTDAYRCVEELNANDVPVIYGPLFDAPSGFRAGTGEARRYRYSAPAELLKAGLTVALSAGDLTNEGALPRQAMYAMRFGLTRAQALAAVTTTPARLLEIDDVAGTVAAGRPADIVLWSGEPFGAATRAEVVLIGGHAVKDVTKKEVSREVHP